MYNHTTKWKDQDHILYEGIICRQNHFFTLVCTVVRTTDIKTKLVCGASTEIRSICYKNSISGSEQGFDNLRYYSWITVIKT